LSQDNIRIYKKKNDPEDYCRRSIRHGPSAMLLAVAGGERKEIVKLSKVS
jgi:hypothetical protein